MATHATGPTDTDPSPWVEAVAAALQERDLTEPRPFPKTIAEVSRILKILTDSGRCVVTGQHGAFQVVTGMAKAQQMSVAGFNGKHAVSKASKDWAVCFTGERGSWIASVLEMTYLPGRPGSSTARSVFHLRLGPVTRPPFVGDPSIPEPYLHFSTGWLLLTDVDFDMSGLLRKDVDPAELDGFTEAVARPRASYVPPEERVAKEEAIAAVRAAYETHRGDMPRAVRQDDVDVIVREGLRQGLMINLALVHAATQGRGSPNSVYQKLGDAMARFGPRVDGAAGEVDPALAALWRQLKASAVETAKEEIAPIRAALDGQRAELNADRSRLAAEREQDVKAAEERQRQQERLEEELSEARERIESLGNVERGQLVEIEGFKHERASLQHQLTVASDALTALRITHADVQTDRDRTRTELARQERLNERQRETATTEMAEVAAALEREAKAAMDRLAEVNTLQQELTKARAALHDSRLAKSAWEAERTGLADKLARETAEKVAVQAAAADASVELTTWRQRHDEVAEARLHVSGELANLRAEHQAVMRERDRLEALLNRIGSHPASPAT